MEIFKELILNTDLKYCAINGEDIKLIRSEYNLLKFFLEHRNKVFSIAELIKNVWEENVSYRAVTTNISRLRKKLGDYGIHIINRPTFGYGFIENIE